MWRRWRIRVKFNEFSECVYGKGPWNCPNKELEESHWNKGHVLQREFRPSSSISFWNLSAEELRPWCQPREMQDYVQHMSRWRTNPFYLQKNQRWRFTVNNWGIERRLTFFHNRPHQSFEVAAAWKRWPNELRTDQDWTNVFGERK